LEGNERRERMKEKVVMRVKETKGKV